MKQTAIYLRVSTFDQAKGLASQKTACIEYCDNHNITNYKIYQDRVSGAKTDRPAFNRLQKAIFNGDISTVLCWKLDRISRSLKDGIDVLCDWTDRGIRVVSVTQQIDLSGTVGKMIASVLLAVAQMERENISENVKRGLATAKANGVQLGRRATIDLDKVKQLKDIGVSMSQIASDMGVTRQGLYKALK